MEPKTIRIFSPAKVNLYLHITGRRDNGYHELDSLVAFANVGDEVEITPAREFSFSVTGAFAGHFGDAERDASPCSSNIAVKAAYAMGEAVGRSLDFSLHLRKNLPLAGGIGGGSANAAAVIWGLMRHWDIPTEATFLDDLMIKLGADVPVCLRCKTVRMGGIGEVFEPAAAMSAVPILLIHPGLGCSTPKVFQRYDTAFREKPVMPDDLTRLDELVAFLGKNSNDLYEPACHIIPEIRTVIDRIGQQDGCALARMSGSGSTCFGLFNTQAQADQAARDLRQDHPDWWIESGTLGGLDRY